MKIFFQALLFLLVATILEVMGDATIRKALYQHENLARFGLFCVGAVFLFGYGLALNLAPLEFGRVVGLYIATLFIIWQVGNYVAFQTLPTLPILVGGTFIIVGGIIVSVWKP